MGAPVDFSFLLSRWPSSVWYSLSHVFLVSHFSRLTSELTISSGTLCTIETVAVEMGVCWFPLALCSLRGEGWRRGGGERGRVGVLGAMCASSLRSLNSLWEARERQLSQNTNRQQAAQPLPVWFKEHLWLTGGNYFRTDSQHWHHVSWNGMQNDFSVLCYNNAVIMIIRRPRLFERCSQDYF